MECRTESDKGAEREAAQPKHCKKMLLLIIDASPRSSNGKSKRAKRDSTY